MSLVTLCHLYWSPWQWVTYISLNPTSLSVGFLVSQSKDTEIIEQAYKRTGKALGGALRDPIVSIFIVYTTVLDPEIKLPKGSHCLFTL